MDTHGELLSFLQCPPKIQKQVTANLGQEFYGFRDSQAGTEKFERDLRSGDERGLVMTQGEALLGVITTKEHPFLKISPQLYIDPEYENGKLSRLRLRPFQQLLNDHGFNSPYDSAFEIAYMHVPKIFRGHGISSKLFNQQIEDIKQKSAGKLTLTFTLARGIYAQSEIQTQLTAFMLEWEKSTNGTRPDGKVNVTGTWVSIQACSNAVGHDLSVLNANTGADATIHMMQKIGGESVGFFRNMSPVWCVNTTQQ